jgi:hypothetical protein
MTTATTLTDKQELFLEALMGPARGDPYRAKELAGYGPQYSLRQILKAIGNDIPRETAALIELYSLKATHKLVELLDDPTMPGGPVLVNAANSILDRAGVIKKDKLEVNFVAPTALVYLPLKKTEASEAAQEAQEE